MTSTVFPERLLPALDRALEYTYGAHDRATVQNAIESGMMQLWEGWHSFVVTELLTAPTGQKTVRYFLAGGLEGEAGLQELARMAPIIEAWAVTQGAVGLTMVGRHGWARTFLTKDAGWEASLTYYTKELV